MRRTVEARAEDGVHHHIVGADIREIVFAQDVEHRDLGLVHEAVVVHLAVVAHAVAVAHHKHLRDHLLLVEHPCHGEAVSAVVAHAAEDLDGLLARRAAIQPLKGLSCRPFHQVDGLDGFVFYRVFVRFADLFD